jgi:septal ring factor EnvC (AmiA/AmiB activator)
LILSGAFYPDLKIGVWRRRTYQNVLTTFKTFKNNWTSYTKIDMFTPQGFKKMAAVTKKDMVDVLNEFYGKVLEPRFDRIEKRLDDHDQKFKDILDHFDTLYVKLDILETEYHAINAGISRIEKQLEGIEKRFNGLEKKLDTEISTRELLEKQIAALKERVSKLQERIEEIDLQLKSNHHSSS